jgi:hypothetical protein
VLIADAGFIIAAARFVGVATALTALKIPALFGATPLCAVWALARTPARNLATLCAPVVTLPELAM